MWWTVIVVANAAIYNGYAAWRRKGQSGLRWGLIAAAAASAAIFGSRAIAATHPEWAAFADRGPTLTILAGGVAGFAVNMFIQRLPDPTPTAESQTTS